MSRWRVRGVVAKEKTSGAMPKPRATVSRRVQTQSYHAGRSGSAQQLLKQAVCWKRRGTFDLWPQLLGLLSELKWKLCICLKLPGGKPTHSPGGSISVSESGESREPPVVSGHEAYFEEPNMQRDGRTLRHRPAPSRGETLVEHPEKRARNLWVWGVCGFLVLAVGLVFARTAAFEFVNVDDGRYVYQNPHVSPGLTLDGLGWAFSDTLEGEFYPLTSLSHMLDCQLYGLKPAGHHVTNVVLHAISAVLLFLALLRMTGELWPSAWVAAIFAIHPLHVSTVAWVAERREVLSGLFFMLMLGAYALYAERPSLARYLAALGCMAFGLMSKPVLVTAPFLLLLLDYWPLGRFSHQRATEPCGESGSRLGRLPVGWRLLIEKIPFLALAVTSCMLTVVMHKSNPLTGHLDPLSLPIRLANALVSYAAYVRQSFFPVDLSPFYPHLGPHLPVAWVVESAVLLLAISAVAIYWWRRRPYVLVGWLWFLGMQVPMLGLVGSFFQSRADNYTYLSQIGLSIAVAWTGWSFCQAQEAAAARWRLRLLETVFGATVLILAAVAYHQTSYWQNSETMWNRSVACNDENALAHHNLGTVYASQGRGDEAIAHFEKSLAAYCIGRFVTADAHAHLAECLTAQGKLTEAIEHLRTAEHILPEAERFRRFIAMALGRAGRLDEAVAKWRETLRLFPNSSQIRFGLADALLSDGKSAEAAEQSREILKQQPDLVKALVTLGGALTAEGEIDEAIIHLTRATQLDPNDAWAQFRLGVALNERNETTKALTHLNEAIRLDGRWSPMLWRTAWIFATSTDPSIRDGTKAVELADRAVQVSGGQDVHALDALAAALAESKRFPAAIEVAEQAATMALLREDIALADSINERKRLYRQGLPFRQARSARSTDEAQPSPAD
jgi:protein O-mannosyl-transferase